MRGRQHKSKCRIEIYAYFVFEVAHFLRHFGGGTHFLGGVLHTLHLFLHGFEGAFDQFQQRFGGFLLQMFGEPTALLHHIQRERAVAIGVTGLQRQSVDSDSGTLRLTAE